MTWAQYTRILGRLQEQEIKLNYLHFTGGEPTLWTPLKNAIRMAKDMHIAKRIRVITNGVNRNAEDYGQADIVHISHYGAINRQDICRLKKQLGRKVKVQYTVHLPWPVPRNKNALPAQCGCVNLAFVQDRVYPCGMTAARNVAPISVEEPFYQIFLSSNPMMQELCEICLTNRNNKQHYMTGLTAEFGVWDSAISHLWSFKTKGWLFRKLYRALKT